MQHGIRKVGLEDRMRAVHLVDLLVEARENRTKAGADWTRENRIDDQSPIWYNLYR